MKELPIKLYILVVYTKNWTKTIFVSFKMYYLTASINIKVWFHILEQYFAGYLDLTHHINTEYPFCIVRRNLII